MAACPWLGDDYFLATIRTPSANHRLLSAQSDQSEASIASLNITFLPPSVLPLMGRRQDHYYAGVRTGKLNLDTVVKCLLIVTNVDLDSLIIGSDLVLLSIDSS